jgi:Glycosyl hydrolases family 43
MSGSVWNRRNLIHAAAQMLGAIGAVAAVGPAQAQAGKAASKATNTPGLTTDLLKQTRLPFRIGFDHVFDPSVGEKEPWYLNDHCLIRANDGTWHLFGITHKEPADPDHESFFLHATAPDVKGPWKKQAPVMHIDPAFNETVVWAPHVVAHDGKYWMFYCAGGKDHEQFHIHLATSPDLVHWTRHPGNPMIVDGYDARDPMALHDGNQWILYYCATETPKGGNHVVKAVTSADLVHWSQPRIVFRSPEKGTFGGPTESPFVVPRNGKYYLFVCTNEPYNNSAAYVSDSPLLFDPAKIVMNFPAHGAEVIRTPDERWFVSTCGWEQGGLYLAELHWDDHA